MRIKNLNLAATAALLLGICSSLAYAQGYNSGGYGGNTGAAGGSGGSGPVTGGSCGSNQFATRIATNGAPVCAQPSAAQVTGLAPSATNDTTNASNITSGSLSAGGCPILRVHRWAASRVIPRTHTIGLLISTLLAYRIRRSPRLGTSQGLRRPQQLIRPTRPISVRASFPTRV
jgi:hypothetical protein